MRPPAVAGANLTDARRGVLRGVCSPPSEIFRAGSRGDMAQRAGEVQVTTRGPGSRQRPFENPPEERAISLRVRRVVSSAMTLAVRSHVRYDAHPFRSRRIPAAHTRVARKSPKGNAGMTVLTESCRALGQSREGWGPWWQTSQPATGPWVLKG